MGTGKSSKIRIYVPLYDPFHGFLYPLISEFGPLAFAIGFSNFLTNLHVLLLVVYGLKVLLLTLALCILYEWIYVVNEYVTKYEPTELKTKRFDTEVSIEDVVVSFFLRIALQQTLLIVGMYLGVLTIHEYLRVMLICCLLLIIMVLHQVLSWELRSLITLPSLRILRVLFVFLPIANNPLEKYWVFAYAYITMLPHLLNYFGSKLLRIKLKQPQYFLTFSRETFTFSKKLFSIVSTFVLFYVAGVLVFNSDSMTLLKMVEIPLFILIYLCLYELLKRILLKISFM